MYDHGQGKNTPEDLSKSATNTSEADRRGNNRHSFIASADVVDINSGTRFSTRTSDLGPGGCFVDSLTPFPVGTPVHVHVQKGYTDFETDGVVIYSQTGLGMGIAFKELPYEQKLEMEAWLAEITNGKQVVHDAAPPPRQIDSTEHAGQPIARLVKLLIEKRILTEAEAATVFQKLVI